MFRKSFGLVLPLLCLFAVSAPVSAETSQAEIAFWQSIANSKDAAEFEAYLSAYPNGKFAPLAKLRLSKLNKNPTSTGVKQAGAVAAKLDPKIRILSGKLKPWPGNPSRARLGINLRDVSDKDLLIFGSVNTKGIVVTSIGKDSAAEEMGLCNLHILTSINDTPIKNRAHLVQLLSNMSPGDVVSFKAIDYEIDQPEVFATKLQQKSQLLSDPNKLHILGEFIIEDLSSGHKREKAIKIREMARTMLERSANMGNVDAMYSLGQMSRRFLFTTSEDVKWLLKAAATGHVDAMNKLGWAYKTGNAFDKRGVARNAKEAARWFRRSAQTGNAEGLLNLARLYRDGKGVSKDHNEAARLMRTVAQRAGKEASFSVDFARYELGQLYDQDKGVLSNRKRAAELFIESHAVWCPRLRSSYREDYFKQLPSEWSKGARRHIQRALKNSGHYSGSADGNFGVGTQRGFMRYCAEVQKANVNKSKSSAGTKADRVEDIRKLEKLE